MTIVDSEVPDPDSDDEWEVVVEHNTTPKKIRKNRKKYQTFIAHYLYHNAMQLFLALVLLLSLFLPDFWTIANPANDQDPIFNMLLIVCIVVFSIEIILLCLVQADYINSLFFWMDVIGTVSCVFDLTYVTDVVAESGATDTRTLRAARIAKIGAKAGRLTRITKFLKFLYFNANHDDAEAGLPVENVSSQLTLALSQRVAGLIMLLVIINPLLTNTVLDYSASTYLGTWNDIASKNVYDATDWGDAVQDFKHFYDKARDSGETLIIDPVWLKMRYISGANCPTAAKYNYTGFTVTWVDIGGDGFCRYDFDRDIDYVSNNIIRKQNKYFLTTIDRGRYSHNHECNPNIPEFAFICDELVYVDALFDHTEVAVAEAWGSISLICIIIFLLILFTFTFKFAVDALVMQPIARIMGLIRALDKTLMQSVDKFFENQTDHNHDSRAETLVLEKMVMKLSKIVESALGAHKSALLRTQEMDKNTKAWLTIDYVDEDHGRENVRPARQLRRKQSMHINALGVGLTVSDAVVNSLDLDILSLKEDDLPPMVLYILERFALMRAFSIEPDVMDAFINKIRDGYSKTNQYHNFYHGVDVMHTVYQLLEMTRAGEYMGKLEFFASLIAGLAHDLGHFGVNNSFLIRTKHELAILHNDASPLENMHASKLYDILKDPKCNIMSELDEYQFRQARKQILTCILSTDVSVHFDKLKKLEMFGEVHGPFITDFMTNIVKGPYNLPPCLEDKENRLLLQECFMRAADLGNPVMPLEHYKKWVGKITEEFFSQGDKEKEAKISVSPMCERESTNIPKMQLGFMEFVVAPFYLPLFSIFPDGLLPLAKNLEKNYCYYATVREQEAPKETTHLHDQVMQFRYKLKATGIDFHIPRDKYSLEYYMNHKPAVAPRRSTVKKIGKLLKRGSKITGIRYTAFKRASQEKGDIDVELNQVNKQEKLTKSDNLASISGGNDNAGGSPRKDRAAPPKLSRKPSAEKDSNETKDDNGPAEEPPSSRETGTKL